FGFGSDLSIPIEVTPSVAPTPENKAEAALTSIGQLDVRSTPLQIAMMSAAIANDGVIMHPQLIDEVLAPNLTTEQSFRAQEYKNPISEKTAKELTDMMVAGVNDSDGAAAKAKIEGVTVAGKTGTAQNGTDESGEDLPYTIWF